MFCTKAVARSFVWEVDLPPFLLPFLLLSFFFFLPPFPFFSFPLLLSLFLFSLSSLPPFPFPLRFFLPFPEK